MAENSKIEWTDHTFNPWVGCTKISPACAHCYAESWAKRSGSPALWQGERRRTTEAYWRQPLKWNRDARAAGVRRKVFCASLADVFDNQVPADWRADLWAYIAETPNVDWLLLTKRPQNIAKMLPGSCVEQLVGRDLPWPWPNVWLGTTAEDQHHFDQRWRYLAETPAAVRFLSYEPALGPLCLREAFGLYEAMEEGNWALKVGSRWAGSPDWVIAGGESGPGARPAHPAWFRGLRGQCIAAGVPYFFKQWGEWAPGECANGGPTKTERTATWWDGEWMFDSVTPRMSREMHRDDEPDLYRLGKRAAGALLDGREWREMPNV